MNIEQKSTEDVGRYIEQRLTEDFVRHIAARVLELEDGTPIDSDKSLTDDYGMDSLNLTDFLGQVAAAFNADGDALHDWADQAREEGRPLSVNNIVSYLAAA